jgi:hypothetical protein
MTSTGFVMTNGKDISTLFEPYSGGTQSALSNYVISNGKDLNEVFDPHTGTDASATGFFVVDGVGVEKDLNKVFAKIKQWNNVPFYQTVVNNTNYRTFLYNYVNQVSSIDVVSNTEIYVGGQSSWSGSRLYERFAKYNGSTWSTIGWSVSEGGTSSSGSSTNVTGIKAFSSTDIYLTGYFDTIRDTQSSGYRGAVWCYDGANYSGISGISGATVNQMLVVSASEIYFRYQNTIKQYNKLTSTVVRTITAPTNTSFRGNICSVDASFLFGMTQATVSPFTGRYIVRINKSTGTSSIVSSWNNVNVTGLWGVDIENIYIYGSFTGAFAVNANYIVKYNGNTNTFTNINGIGHVTTYVKYIHFESNRNIYVIWNNDATLSKYSSATDTWSKEIEIQTIYAGSIGTIQAKNGKVYVVFNGQQSGNFGQYFGFFADYKIIPTNSATIRSWSLLAYYG